MGSGQGSLLGGLWAHMGKVLRPQDHIAEHVEGGLCEAYKGVYARLIRPQDHIAEHV